MKQHVTIAVVCLARTTFDYTAAEELYSGIKDQLRQIDQVQFETIDNLVIEPEDAMEAAEHLVAKNVDGLICISGTFHLGHLVLELNKTLNVPIMLWALDELPYDGGKIRLNSACGVNLDASNLYKAGVRSYHVNFGMAVDENWIDAIRVQKALRRSRIGIAGFRAEGFFNLGYYDLSAYREMGFLVDHYELSDIFGFEAPEAEVMERAGQIKETFDTSGITQDQLLQTSRLATSLDGFMKANRLSALALRCWPEFAQGYGIAPCAAKSFLLSEDHIIACEGDLEGAVSMLAHQALGGETPFLADLSQVNFDEDYALLWHCGDAPCNLWDEKCQISLDSYHAGGKGVTADFVMKTGDTSLLRIDSAPEGYRIFLAEAESLPMEKDLRGTYAKVRFAQPIRDVLDKVVYNGIAHHVSMVYGSFGEPLRILARIKGWQVIE